TGYIGLPRCRCGTAVADTGVDRLHGYPLQSEFGPHDLLHHGDQTLANLTASTLHSRTEFPGNHPKGDTCGRIVVEPFGEADVLDTDRVADATHHTLPVGGIGDAARQPPEVEFVRTVGGQRLRRDPADQLGDRSSGVDPLSGRQHRAFLHRVAGTYLHGVDTARRGEFVHLGLIGEPGLYRAESPHRTARRVVGEHAPTVHRGVRHVVRSHAERGSVPDDGGGRRSVGTTVQVDPRLRIADSTVP